MWLNNEAVRKSFKTRQYWRLMLLSPQWMQCVEHEAAFMIQRAYRIYVFRKKRQEAAKVIQRAVSAWIDKPITKDGKLGITCRIMRNKFNV